jgi:hypothetical protein
VAKDQTTWTFDGQGRLLSVLDPHNLGRTYAYTSSSATSTLATVSELDGGVATFSYSSNLLSSIAEPGGHGDLGIGEGPLDDQELAKAAVTAAVVRLQ